MSCAPRDGGGRHRRFRLDATIFAHTVLVSRPEVGLTRYLAGDKSIAERNTVQGDFPTYHVYDLGG